MKLLPKKISEAASRINIGGEVSFFIYDTSVMAEKIKYLFDSLPSQVSIYYAMKANPHHAFLDCAYRNGAAGVEIASLGEGKKAIEAGFRGDQLIFTGPGKSREELMWSVKNKVRTIHIDSLVEARRLDRICQALRVDQDILVRVNPEIDVASMADAQAVFTGKASKMGIDTDKFIKQLPQLKSLKNLNFRGLHVYAASGLLCVDDLISNVTAVFEIAQKIEASDHNIKCEIINFGGGFGVDYTGAGSELNVAEYTEKLKNKIEAFGLRDREFILELGRYLTADAGWYCTEVFDIKRSRDRATGQDMAHIICGGGSHHFRRPIAVTSHPIETIAMQRPDEGEVVEKEIAFIGGTLCNTADKLFYGDKYPTFESVKVGDLVVFCLAGGYGKTLSHLEFLSHDWPREFIVR